MKLAIVSTCTAGVFVLNGCGSTSSEPESTLSGSTCVHTVQDADFGSGEGSGGPNRETRVEVTGLSPEQHTACCPAFQALFEDQTALPAECAFQNLRTTIHIKCSQGGHACSGTSCLISQSNGEGHGVATKQLTYGMTSECCQAAQSQEDPPESCANTNLCVDVEFSVPMARGIALFSRAHQTYPAHGGITRLIAMSNRNQLTEDQTQTAV